MKWRGAIEGPVGSSYEGGLFNLDIIIPDDYPLSPSKVSECALVKTAVS